MERKCFYSETVFLVLFMLAGGDFVREAVFHAGQTCCGAANVRLVRGTDTDGNSYKVCFELEAEVAIVPDQGDRTKSKQVRLHICTSWRHGTFRRNLW